MAQTDTIGPLGSVGHHVLSADADVGFLPFVGINYRILALLVLRAS